MWELICDQRYQWGLIAADRSGYRSDGIPTGVAASAYGPGINIQYGRIAIPRKKPWDELKGIRVEMIVRFFDAWGTLISGDGSFQLDVRNGGVLTGEAGGDVIDTSVSGVPIRDDVWRNITFVHNGLNAMAPFIDGQITASGPAAHQVPGVGPAGVFIGAPTPLGDQFWLSGEIASVRVWRVDPRSDELQADLDSWIAEYNEARPHQGRWCFGKTPMQTFLDAMPIAKEKMIAA
jgi:hypothetical protein